MYIDKTDETKESVNDWFENLLISKQVQSNYGDWFEKCIWPRKRVNWIGRDIFFAITQAMNFYMLQNQAFHIRCFRSLNFFQTKLKI